MKQAGRFWRSAWATVAFAAAATVLLPTGVRGQGSPTGKLQLVGHVVSNPEGIPSPTALALLDHYALLGVGAQLRVVDASDPTRLLMVGQSEPLPGTVNRLVVQGSLVYVLDGRGLRILNVASQDAPALLGGVDIPNGTALAASQNFAFVAAAEQTGQTAATTVHVIDVSDPTVPQEVSAYAFSGDPSTGITALAAAGNYLFLGEGTAGLDVVDVSDAALPVSVARVPSESYIVGLTLAPAGSPLYVAAKDYDIGPHAHFGRDSLSILDVQNPSHPIPIGEKPGLGAHGPPTLGAGRLYARSGDDTLQVFALNEGKPAASLGTITYPGLGAGLVALDSTLLTTHDGLRALDAASLAATREIGSYLVPHLRPTRLALDGSLLAVSEPADAVTTGQLVVFDVSNPAQPQLRGSVDLPHLSPGAELQFDAGLAALTDPSPSQPAVRAVNTAHGNPWALSATSVGDRFAGRGWLAGGYLATIGPGGLQLVDLRDLADVPKARILAPDVKSGWVRGKGSYWYVLISDPPRPTGELTPNRLVVYDASNPENPIRLGELGGLGGGGDKADLAVSGDRAYVLNSFLHELQVVDITDPSRPRLAGSTQIPFYTDVARIAVDGSRVTLVSYQHAADCDCFVYIAHLMDAADPGGAVELAVTATGLEAPDIVLDGRTMYVAARDSGLAIFQYVPVSDAAPDTDGAAVAGGSG